MRRASVCLCFVLLGAVAVAEAQEDQFQRGVRAREEQRWRDVITQMGLAIAADAKESNRKVGRNFLGMGGMEYLPYFFLGEAHYRLNDCGPAVEAWAASEQQGVIKQRPDLYRILTDGNAACEARGVLMPGKFEAARGTTQKYYEEANGLALRLQARADANADVWRPDMRESYERAAAELRESYAKFASGSKTRLLSEFNESRAAANRARNALAALDSALSAAIETTRSIKQQAAEIEQLLVSAEEYDREIESKKSQWTAAHNAGIQAGRVSLARGRERLETAARGANVALLPEARNLALDATARLKQVLDDLGRMERLGVERQLSELLVVGNEVFSFVDGGFATLIELIRQKPDLATPDVIEERDAIERDASAARRRFEGARKTENLAGVREAIRIASEARERQNALITRFGPLTLTQRGVHPVLQEGARLFFEGQYQPALTALEAANGFGAEVTLQPHVHLLRAAALHALFVRSGESDLSLRTRALEEVARCRALNPEIVPDSRFSPRFVAFFQSNGTGDPTRGGDTPRP